MYNIFLVVFSIVFANAIEPKICINCKHFKKDFFTLDELAKCQAFPKILPKIEENNNYLITGIQRTQNVDYHYCGTARQFDSMCGEEGKKYEKNKKVV
jgi:hypothetical protein